MSRAHNSTCEFCHKINEGQTTNRRNWYDFLILTENDGFVAIPAVGSIVPGYLLIVTKRHVPSMAHLNHHEMSRLLEFCDLMADLQRRISSQGVIKLV